MQIIHLNQIYIKFKYSFKKFGKIKNNFHIPYNLFDDYTQ